MVATRQHVGAHTRILGRRVGRDDIVVDLPSDSNRRESRHKRFKSYNKKRVTNPTMPCRVYNLSKGLLSTAKPWIVM